jgi:hypothetical protein
MKVEVGIRNSECGMRNGEWDERERGKRAESSKLKAERRGDWELMKKMNIEHPPAMHGVLGWY